MDTKHSPEVLPRNHPRFCAKYRRYVGEFTFIERWPQTLPTVIDCGGMKFAAVGPAHGQHEVSFEVGQRVYLARRIPTMRSQPRRWQLHEIELPEQYLNYVFWARRTLKERRQLPYEARPQTWFGLHVRLFARL